MVRKKPKIPFTPAQTCSPSERNAAPNTYCRPSKTRKAPITESIVAARPKTSGSSEKGQTKAGAAKTSRSEIAASSVPQRPAATIARGQACSRSPAPTALPTRTPAAEPKPMDRANAILWMESMAWKAPAAALPSWVESTIRVEKPASSSIAPRPGTRPNQARRGTPRSARRRAGALRSRTRRSTARGRRQTVAIIANAPSQEMVAVA